MAGVTIDGSIRELSGRAPDRSDQSRWHSAPAGLLPPAARSDSDLRHLHGRGRRQAGARLRDRRSLDGMDVFDNVGACATRRSARPSTASSAITCSIARSATTTTATAPSTTPTKLLAVEHQTIPFQPKPYEVDHTNPFYRYDPDQCILCGRCVEACQNVQVNETLSIRWEDPHPRVLWDGGATDRRIELCFVRPLRHRLPLQCADGEIHARPRGFLTALPKPALNGMIDVVKGIEPETGYGAILQVSEAEAAMRESRIRRTKTVCTYCGVGCSFDIWTKDRHILKVEPARRPGQRHLHLRQRKVRLGFREQPGPPDQAADPRRRQVPRGHLGRGSRSGGAQIDGDQGRRRTGLAGVHLLVEMHQ